MTKKNNLKVQIESGILTGTITFFVYFLITFYWQLNGLTDFNLIMLSILSGLILLIVSPIYLFFNLRKFYNRQDQENKPKRRYFIGFIFIITIITIIILDVLIFIFDNSLSIEYLDYLNSLDPKNSIEYVLPMTLLNIIPIIVFGLISYFISILIVSKNEK
ncbi:hypothetical protein [Winogradskyella sp.]|uniref:hypothetical protein n=1 Tax=Winogradskyella sp. TaxID=1883156 RepID=UPI0025F33904|nr:hypothetical protein [Winogradskyella sp.]MBT8243897.1 hypothetical protein [Winogradskyella sp.]